MKRVFFILLGIVFFSCGKNPPKEEPVKKSSFVSRAGEDFHRVYYNNKETGSRYYGSGQNFLYVINPVGADQFEVPDTNSRPVGRFAHAELIRGVREVDTTVNGIKSTWYETTTTVKRTVMIKGTYFSADVNEKIFVRPKDLGDQSKIVITSKEIYESYDSLGRITQFSKKTFKIENISRSEFYRNPTPDKWIRKSYYWTYQAIEKRIVLPLNKVDTLLRFDNEPYEAETDFHVRMEDMEQLNCYMIYAGYYEGHGFLLYDRNTGERKASLIGYPCVSPDTTYLVCVYDCPYCGCCEMELYKITETGPYELIERFSFLNWVPEEDPIDFVWVTNRQFKLKVKTFAKHFRQEEGWPDEPTTGYLKFTIK